MGGDSHQTIENTRATAVLPSGKLGIASGAGRAVLHPPCHPTCLPRHYHLPIGLDNRPSGLLVWELTGLGQSPRYLVKSLSGWAPRRRQGFATDICTHTPTTSMLPMSSLCVRRTSSDPAITCLGTPSSFALGRTTLPRARTGAMITSTRHPICTFCWAYTYSAMISSHGIDIP